MRHLVLGTAGHIDHGKSALVLALTGTDPDRLAEEKRRGITIDLGFADLQLDAERVLSFVDVPGHERFVRHMVAGATGIDAVLLVVAGDQGVQPQTREHLEICRLLGLQRGVVALTKCDLVDADLREVAALELRDLLQNTFLENAALVPVSSRTGLGLAELRAELVGLFDRVEPRQAGGVPRLAVDRSFVLRGFGTVVTGTLVSGTFREGDEIEVLPWGRRGRIRGLQVHHTKVTQAAAGQRTAINIQGLGCDDVPRGSTITRPGAMSSTRRIWARLTLLESAPQKLHKGGLVRFHQGTCERAARYRVLDAERPHELRVELFLDQATVLVPGDRFVLRRPAPIDTVGGGIVVDARPPRARGVGRAAFNDEALDSDSALMLRVERASDAGQDAAALATELGLTTDQLERRAQALEGTGQLVRCGSRWYAGDLWDELGDRVQRRLARFHVDEPLRVGMPREELRASVSRGLAQDAWRQLLDGLAASGLVALRADKVAVAGHRVELAGAERELAERIESAFREGGLEPPELADVAGPDEIERAARIVDLLIADGRLVRIHGGKLLHARPLASLRERLLEYARSSRTIDVAAFKQLAGVTRKHAIPLLEHLDAQRVTRRVGNLREILPGD